MAYAEKRGKTWRARWRAPDGALESKPGFKSRKEAEEYGRDQEAAIRADTYVDPRGGRITLTDWVNRWYPALDLEPTTLANYRYLIEVHILPAFGDRPLASLTAEEIGTWERGIAAGSYSQRTARDARSVLVTILGDAIPHYLKANPAQRRRGKGRKGRRRIELHERAEKAWPTPLQALLVAERCAALSGCDTDFVMVTTIAYTGMRWSEAVGLRPQFVRADQLGIEWKLYELRGRFYLGRPKDGSIRPADLPPFLADLLADHIAAPGGRTCTCSNAEPPWCPGDRYVFLGPGRGHFRRSGYGERFFRPAADGWYPARGQRPTVPVLADVSSAFPGRPVPPWPPAVPGEPFEVPSRRGLTRLASDAATGRCAHCGRAFRRRLNGNLIAHDAGGRPCPGGRQPPAEDVVLASWLPILPGLTPHGLRHGHQTWMEEAGTSDLLRSERMGHEVPGMRGIYGHVTPAMREALTAMLQDRWEASLLERARISPRSIVPVLDALLASQRQPPAKIGSQSAPKIGRQ